MPKTNGNNKRHATQQSVNSAVNPNRRRDEDTRTPEELLTFIETKGQEVTSALAALRK